jgi:hypothetical protein
MKPTKFDEQLQLERLKKEKWSRWERMILTLCLAASIVFSGLHGGSMVSLITRWFG